MFAEIGKEIETAEKSLLEELIEKYKGNERLPGDVTANELAEKLNVTQRFAYEILDKEVKEGKIIKIKGKGHQIYYRRTGNLGVTG